MLNELYMLDRSLQRFNASVEESHPWVKRLGRADLLIAGVDASGLVTTIEYAGKESAVTLFKIQESNHTNFPAVNWPSPVWQMDQGSVVVQDWLATPADDVRRRAGLLRAACETSAMSPGQDRVVRRMLEFCRELTPRFQADGEEFAAFPVLMERLLAAPMSAGDWLRSLSNAALCQAECGSAGMLAAVESLLAGKFDKRTARFQEIKTPILLDLADCTKFRYRVANPRMGSYFSRRLNATEAAGAGGGRCALTGLEMPLEMGKMPSPRLPVLGDAVLMSMNPDTPCQTRYGRIGADVFPIGKKTASDLNAALIHLTAPERKRKNWMPIPGTTKKKFNLLLVYLDSAPLFEANIAEVFAGTEEAGELYKTICENVCEAFRGRNAYDSELLHVFVLNKIDPGRVQVELNEVFTAGQVISGAREWNDGASNRPVLSLKEDHFVPSPTDVMRCMQMMWERGGASYSDAPGCRLADVFDLLIASRPGAKNSAKLLLRMTLQRTSDLLLAIGHATHGGGKAARKNISREAGRNPVVAAALLGITLKKLGHAKENYMRDPAFLVGRFLSLADTLHAEYSKQVRKDLPPQLLGNALIPTAIGDPRKGFARMLQRLRVYQAWARRDGTGLARWSCGEMGKIASEVAPNLPDHRLNEAQQAQLLLGYMARSESGQENANEEGENN